MQIKMSEKIIILVCNAEMSASMFVTKIQKAPKTQGFGVDIFVDAINWNEKKPILSY